MDAPPAQTSSPQKPKQQTRLEDEAVVLLGGDDFRGVPRAIDMEQREEEEEEEEEGSEEDSLNNFEEEEEEEEEEEDW